MQCFVVVRVLLATAQTWRYIPETNINELGLVEYQFKSVFLANQFCKIFCVFKQTIHMLLQTDFPLRKHEIK